MWLTPLAAATLLAGCAAPVPPDAPAHVVAPVVHRFAVREAPRDLPGSIVFHSDRDGRRRVYALHLASGGLRALTAGGDHHDIEPAWSRDGRSMAFSTTGFDNRSYDLAVVADAGEPPRRVADDLAEDGRPAWAADGRSLFFNSRREGTQAVFRTWLESGRVDRVSPRGERALMPSAAPDGKRLAYVAASTAGLHAVVRDLDTGATEWTSPAEAADPRWSPDGARLAYVRVWPGGSALDVMTRATGAIESMTVDGVAALREPAWSPDGRWLAAAATASTSAGADWDLLVIDPVERTAARITTGAGIDRSPTWTAR
jgi:Tol biopolymer transport system component